MTRTARQAYDENQARLEAAIEKLQRTQREHAEAFRAEGEKNWGYVGDICHWADQVEELVSGE